MKFIKNGIILEPHNDFVIAQMQKAGYQVYEETKEKVNVDTKEEIKDTKDEKQKAKKKK